jgi:hypothetical protein
VIGRINDIGGIVDQHCLSSKLFMSYQQKQIIVVILKNKTYFFKPQ